jgi:putative transposase
VTDTAVELETVEPVESAQPGQTVSVSDEQLVAMLVERARAEGLQLTGQGGLLQLTKRVLESALEGETTDHLGCERHDAAGRGSGNSRKGAGRDRADRCRAGRGQGPA